MLALGIDTSSHAGSVGLVDEEGFCAELTVRSDVTHSERLLASVQAVLDAAGRRAGDLDLLSVASGPGSFTGLRIGMATAKGIALATQRPLVGFSTLETLAVASGPVGGGGRPLPVCVVMAAGRGEVYRGLYVMDGGRPRAVVPEAVLLPAAAIATLPEGCLVCGGSALFDASGTPALPRGTVIVGSTPSIGAVLARRALAIAADVGLAALPPLVPNYIRLPDAETRSGR